MNRSLGINYGAIKDLEAAKAIRLLEERVARGLNANGVLVTNLFAETSVNLQEKQILLRVLAATPLAVEFSQQARHQPVGTVTISGGSGTPTANTGDVDGVELDAGNDEGIAGSLPIPEAWKGLEVSAYMIWAHSDASATGDVTLQVKALLIAAGDDDSASTTDIAQIVEAAASGGDKEDEFQVTKIGVVPIGADDDLLLYQAIRLGTGLFDTFAAQIWAYTLLFINDN